ncbi:uncharacterized protein LOC116265168 [Nymphaea colorata]|nr:uncharacterized protein LOC116265168 [Nymphaea colorata]
MQRLSLSNSPSRMPPTAGGKGEQTPGSRRDEDEVTEEVEEAKGEKPRQAGCRSERCVHLIPCVLLLCILVLYLFSYDPLQKDASKIADMELFSDRRHGDFMALYSHRSLQQAAKKGAAATPSTPHHRYRKFAAF